MLLITPPAAGTKASTYFTQHSFSFPFYFSTNKNIVILNKQLGVSLISVFSLRCFGRAVFLYSSSCPRAMAGQGLARVQPHSTCQVPNPHSAAVCNNDLSTLQKQPSSAVCFLPSFNPSAPPCLTLCWKLSLTILSMLLGFWALLLSFGCHCCPST